MHDRPAARRAALSFLTLWVCLAIPAGVAAQDPALPQADAEVLTAPVELDGVVLFRVRGVSSFPAAERAGRIRQQIVAVASDRTIPVDLLRIVDAEGITRVQSGDTIIVNLVDADARLETVERINLARAHLIRIQQAILDYRAARTANALAWSGGRVVAATLLLAVAILLIQSLWRWINRAFTHRFGGRIQPVGIQSFQVLRREQVWETARGASLALRTFLLVGLVLVYLGWTLAQFPQTRGLSGGLAAFVLAPLEVMAAGVAHSIPSLVFLTVLFFVLRLGLKVIGLLANAVQRGTVSFEGFQPDWAQPTYRLVRIAVIAFGLVVAYPYIPGSGSAAFQGITVFLGIVFSLGSSTAIANTVAGYLLIYRRAFKVGDRIMIGTSMGDVVETRLQVTHLRTVKNEELIIPNSVILSSTVLNYSSMARTSGLILYTEVGIGYETPWRQVEAMLLQAVGRTPGFSTEPPPFVLEKKLGDFAVTYELNVYCTDPKAMLTLYTALHQNILDVFNEYGVQIMTPAYEGDPPEPKVVAKKDWFTAPAAPHPSPGEGATR